MSFEKEKMRVEDVTELFSEQKSSVISLHGDKKYFVPEWPVSDAEYHASGFCACCMRGE